MAATVRAKGYAHWDGRPVDRRFPWWPITRMGIQLAFRKKRFKLAFAMSFAPAFVFLAGLYISERLEDFQAFVRGSDRLLNITPDYFKIYLTNNPCISSSCSSWPSPGRAWSPTTSSTIPFSSISPGPLGKRTIFWAKCPWSPSSSSS
jgi:hypothetical protein